MQGLAWVTALFAFGALTLALEPAAQAQAAEAAANPHGFIRNDEFSARYASEVQPYWEAHARIDGTSPGIGGISLRYASLVRPDARAAVVISNGRTESFIKYKELAFDLSRAGYSVYILDHRGQGLSPRLLTGADEHDKGHVERFDNLVDDLHTFVEGVVAKGPQKKLFLLAHSMGGAIAVRYLERYPDTFAAAALSSPMLAPNAKIFLSTESSCWWFEHSRWLCPTCFAGFLARPYGPPPKAPNEYTHSSPRWAAVLKEFESHPAARLGGPTRQWAAEACAATDSMLSDAAKVRTPVLLLQAGSDSAVMPQAQDAFCAALQRATGATCQGPQGGPVVIPGAEHELFIEDDAYRMPALNKVFDFLADH